MKFWLFTAAVTIAGAVFCTVMWITAGRAHHVHMWAIPAMTAAYGVAGFCFGWLFFLSDGDGLRR